jgi:hypothetical protein
VLTKTLTISILPNRKQHPNDTKQQHSRVDKLCDVGIFVLIGKLCGHYFFFSDLKCVLTMAQTVMHQATTRDGVHAGTITVAVTMTRSGAFGI